MPYTSDGQNPAVTQCLDISPVIQQIEINGILSANFPWTPKALGRVRTLRLAGIQVSYIQANQSWIVNLFIGELGISNGLVTCNSALSAFHVFI